MSESPLHVVFGTGQVGRALSLNAPYTRWPQAFPPLQRRGAAVLEVPAPDDFLDLAAPDGVSVNWHARGDRPHGQALTAAVRERAGARDNGAAAADGLEEPDGILWDVSEVEAPSGTGSYVWLAGEATSIRPSKALRRHLVLDLGLDRRTVAFMGYWKAGMAEST